MKKILCPVDFSENSMVAAAFAVRMGQRCDCEIKFFYVSSMAVVIPTSAINYNLEAEAATQHLQLRFEELESQIDKLYHEQGLVRDSKRIVCETLDYASIVNGIAEETKKYQADLIIMGTTGTSGLKRLFVGSVTTSVLDVVDCPVLAIPYEFGKRDIKKIGMPTDVINVEKEIWEAVQFAQMFDAELNLFHVSVRQPDGEKLEDKLQFMTGYTNITYTEIHPDYEGDVVGGLNDYVEANHPDMLIMYYTHRNWFDKLISGSRTKNMLFQTKTAVLTFRREKEDID